MRWRLKGEVGFDRALGVEFLEAPSAVVGGDESGDGGGQFVAVMR